MMRMKRIATMAGKTLLAVAYMLIAAFGFLSGMASEGMIGVQDPAAAVLADVLVWFGAIVGLSAVIALAVFLSARKRTIARRISCLTPFVLLALQWMLIAVAEGF